MLAISMITEHSPSSQHVVKAVLYQNEFVRFWRYQIGQSSVQSQQQAGPAQKHLARTQKPIRTTVV